MKVSANNIIILIIVFIIYALLNTILWHYPSKYYFTILFLQLLFPLFCYSSLGSGIIARILGCTSLQKNKDKDKLYPLFDEVYKDVELYIKNINPNIKLMLDESMEVNAFAIGSNRIAITRGALLQLNEEQLKGIIAHEFGHLVHGDNFLSLLLLVGNSYLLILYGSIKFLQLCFALPELIFDGRVWLSKFMASIADLIISIGLLIAELLLLINQRTTEYQADKFAFDIGYGDELLKALYFLDEFPKGKMTLMERLKSSHPNTGARIGKLETLIESERANI